MNHLLKKSISSLALFLLLSTSVTHGANPGSIGALFKYNEDSYPNAWIYPGDNIQDDTIDSSELEDNSVGASEIATNAVGTSEVDDNSLGAIDLAPNSVGNSELVDDITINFARGINYVYGDYGTIARSTDEWLRLNDGNSHTNGIYTSSLFRADGGFQVDGQFVVGADGFIEGNRIRPDSIGSDQIGENAITSSELDNDAVTGDHIQNGSISGVDIGNGQISNNHLGTGAVDGRVILDGSIGSSDIGTGAINGNHILDGSIGSSDIGSGAITGNNIASGSITGEHIAQGSIGPDDLDLSGINLDGEVTGPMNNTVVGDNTIDSNNVQPDSLTAADLHANSVGNSELIDNPTVATLYLGTTDTSLFRDAANRVATDDSLYIRSASPATYLYSTNTYLGGSSGDTTNLRGNNFTWNQGIIQGNGSVGIGDTTPEEKLTVNGRISISTDPNSADDVGDRGYNDARYINVGESGDLIADNTIDSTEIQNNTITESDISDSFKARDSDKLDGVDSTSFLRADQDDLLYEKIIVGSTNNRRAGMYGSYNSTRVGHIWSMGTAYQIPENGANFGNLYGLAYKHTNNTTGGTMAGGHQGVWAQNGVGTAAIGTNIWTSGAYKSDGVTVIGSDAWIEGDRIRQNTVDGSEIQDNSLTASDLAADSVGASELANNSVASANIINNTVNSVDVLDNTLTASDLAADSVGNSELINTESFTMNNLTLNGRTLNLGGNTLYADNSSALYYDGNHSTVTQLIMRDKENTIHGRIVGSDDGGSFGLYDGDGQYSVKAVKDSHVELRDNNQTTFAAGNGGVTGTYGSVSTAGSGKGSYEGYSINGRYVLMSANDTAVGLYNDLDNEWMLYGLRNGAMNIYHNGVNKIQTTPTGAHVSGTIAADAPTANDHLTTKKYVDDLVTLGVSWKAPVPTGSSPTGTYGTCNASKEGWATYNKSDDIIYVCSGSAWVNVGSTASVPYATTSSPGKMQIAGDITGTWNNIQLKASSVGSNEVANNSLTAVDIAPDSIGASELSNNSVGSANVIANSLVADDLAANSVGASEIAANAVGNSELVDDITVNYVRGLNYVYGDYGTIARSTDEWLRLNDGNSHTSGIYTQGLFRADGGLQVDGNFVVGDDGWIEGDRIRQNSIDSSEIENNTITGADILNGTITGTDIGSDTITAANIAANAITASELANSSVTSSHIVDGSIGAADLNLSGISLSGEVTGPMNNTILANNTIDTNNIINNTITENDISDSFVARAAQKVNPLPAYTGMGDLNGTPRSLNDKGLSVGFVRATTNNAPISYGMLMNIPSYTAGQDGGAGQILFPYDQGYTGNGNPMFRVGDYNNAGWATWKTFLDKQWGDTSYVNVGEAINGDTIIDGTIDNSKLAANSVGNSELINTESFTMNNLTLNGRTLNLGGNTLYADNSSALYYDGNHSTVTQLIMRDKENTIHGRIVGSDDGGSFGLYDGDGQYSVKAVKDSHVELRDNNQTTFAAGNGGVTGTYGSVSTAGSGKGSYEGYSINGRYVLMSANDTAVGLYNDLDNQWMLYGARNGAMNLYYDGVNKIQTTPTGAHVSGTIAADTPTANDHLTTKSYVDNLVNGLTWKPPVTSSPAATYGTCTSAKESWTTFNKADNIIYICNGSSWFQMGSSVGIPNLAGEVTGTITSNQVANNVIDTNNIINNTITETDISDSFIARDANLVNGYSHAAFIKVDSSGDQILNDTIDSSELEDNSVGNSELIDNPTVSTIYASNWFRSTGNSGWYNENHGGGLYMADSSWIRTYGNKNFYHNTGIMRTDGTLQVGDNGARFVVNTNGNVGIGITNPGEKLQVNGNIKATAFLYTSDKRLKKNIGIIANPLDKIINLNGVNFDWKDTGSKDVGFIAQDVEKVLPELVKTGDDGIKSVKYGNITAILVEAMKQQQKKIDELTDTVQNLQTEINTLK